jgi:hypothetical protein
MRNVFRVAPWFLVAMLMTGCGSGSVVAKGRLTNKGEPYRCENGVAVHMTFLSLAEGSPEGGAYPAEYYRDGTFRVVGANGRGLPPGKYRVAVQAMKQKHDLLQGAYGAQNSPLVCEVKGASQEVALDLGPSADQRAVAPPARGKRFER